MAKRTPKEKTVKITDLFKKEELKPLEYPYFGKYLVKNPMVHTPEYRARKFLVWKAKGGFGCEEGKIGSGVFATCVADGETCKNHGGDFWYEFVGDVEALKNEP
jgi:hypothetical protein